MEAHSHSHHHSHHSHHHHHPHPEPLRYTQPTQADEAFLDLITSSAFAPPSSIIRRPLTTLAALRRPPIDPIVLAATLSSGPHVTRHHFHHSFDGKQPDASHSQQMPASVRRARIQQQRQKQQQQQQQQQQGESWTTSAGESTSSARASAAAAALSSENQHTDDNNNDKPRYVSTQAPRSLRLAREHSQPGADVDTKAKTALPRQVTPPVPTAETQNSSSSMRRIPAPFPPPPLIVRCHARTRIPTPHGEVFTYIYKNNRDSKEHLALVVDPIQNDDVAVEYYRGKSSGGGGGRVRARKGEIRSTSLDELWGVGESDMERIVRGAYVGRLGGEYQIASAPPSSHPSHSDSDSDDDEEEEESDPPLVRIHSECYTGETIGSQRCDCGEQLDEAIRLIAAEDEIMNPPRHNHHHRRRTAAHRAIADEDSLAQSQAALGSSTPTILTHAPPSPSLPSGEGGGGGGAKPRRARGIVVYLRQEGRGIGLLDKLMAYNLQDMGHDTVSANILLGHSADARTYDVAAAILRDLGVVGGVRLLTNNPEKVEGMEREGVRVFERVPMVPRMWRTRREGGRRRRGGKKTSSSKKKKEGKREKERGTTMLSPVRKTVRAKSPLSSPGMTPSVSGSVSAGVGGAAPFRPSLLGVHSRILSQASGFGTESEDGDGDEGVEYEEEEREDEEGNLSQAEAAEMSLTRSTSSGASGRGRGVAGGGGGVNAAIRFHLSEDPDPAVSQRASSSSPSPSPSSASASDSEEDDEDSDDSYDAHVLRRSGATMIGADVTRSRELERYLRTKVERMGHMLDLPSQGKGEGSAEKGK